MHSSSLLQILHVISFFSLAACTAQIASTSQDTCLENYQWTYNSLGQSPCEVAAYLDYPCVAPNAASIPSLHVGVYYIPPDGTDSPCVCNSVYFYLLSACTACQSGGIEGFQYWEYACPQTWQEEYPENIPPGVLVPNWAYLALQNNGADLTAASSIGGLPEHSGTPTPIPGTITSTVAGAVTKWVYPETTVTSTSTTSIARSTSTAITEPTTSSPVSTPQSQSTTSPDPTTTSSTSSPVESTPSLTSPSLTSSSTSSTLPNSSSTPSPSILFPGYTSSTPDPQSVPTSFTTSGTTLASSSSVSSANSPGESGVQVPDQESTPQQHNSNIGAIAGGAAGGVAALVALAALIYWRRRSSRSPRPTMSSQDDLMTQTSSGYFAQPYQPPPPWTPPAARPAAPLRLYNPDDPSTFPDAPDTYPKTESSDSDGGHYDTMHISGQRGIAEV